MLKQIWRRCWFRHAPNCREPQLRKWREARLAPRLEELETRLAPALFAVSALLEVSRLDAASDAPGGAHAVVFFESAVTDYQLLSQGLAAGTDGVLLDSAGDGVREMAAFLSGRHDLTSVGVVAHGSAGELALGTTALDVANLGAYGPELAVVGSSLTPGGELDLWSCEVAAGQGGGSLVRDLAMATGAGVAASSHMIGDAAQGGTWQLDVRIGGARGAAPFAVTALEAYHEVLGTWSAAGSMATPRSDQTATLLGSGKVLVTGGLTNTGPSSTGYLASAELYDPATNAWSSAGSMASARYQQTATLLGNGKVLVTGGQDNNSNPLASAELYDPVANSWSAASPMATARDEQTATLLANGKVLVTGGVDATDAALASAELYDPATNSWSAASSLATARYLHTATLLGNGTVLVAGGYDTNQNVLAGAELYDPASNTWSAAGSMAAARVLHTATLLPSGKVLVAGGLDNNSSPQSSAELYDPATNKWSAAGSMVTARDQHAATLVNGKVLVTGGADNNSNPLASAELYDPAGNTWSGAGTMAATRANHTATLLGNNKVLVAGGFSPDIFTFLASAEIYDPGTSASSASYFTVTVPTSATTGSAFNVTVKTFDRLGNPFPGYTGTVSITSTDPAAFSLVPSYTFMPGDQGVHTFSVVLNTSTLKSGLGATIIVRDTTAATPPISGLSAPVSVQGLVVAGPIQTTATGFTVTFSKPFVAADLTMYGFNTTTVPDVTMFGTINGNIPGTLFVDPANPNTITFKATNAFLQSINAGIGDKDSVALPDDTYTVTLVSGSGANGFVDALNSHLDGLANGTAANWTTTFATTFQDDAHANANPTPILGIPDFARGPDGATTIKVPNHTAQGIPITLYNAANVQDATFTLTYNPALFTVSGGGTGDSPTGSTFTMGSVTANTATFTYHNATAHSGTVVLGDILATVPNSAASIYKTKELLTLSGITVTAGATVQAANGIHVDAYLGDVHVTASPAIDVSDALDAEKVASGSATGFSAYALLDPAIIGNVGQNLSVDAAAVTNLFSKAVHLVVPRIPAIPAAVTTVSVSGADPTLSLVGGVQPNGIVSVQVMLDHPHPAGSAGMTEAHLALTYDPSVLSISARDITLGSILGTGWQVTAEVNAATGQIGITLYNLSRTPITAEQAGSLVNITFHIVPGAAARATVVQLVDQVTMNGQRLVTDVDDDQGPLVLGSGLDRLVVKLFPTIDAKRLLKRT